ncbi:AAA family ATPase [Candidatus Dojkabacteria bacterium]|nr:AAA family ATPase [Candidatus Dojkabacteria bacterium]
MKQNLEQNNFDNQPLAARMRPQNLDEFIGQEHLVGQDKPIRKLIEADDLVSMIFWGPPGCGKTTLARIIANETNSNFVQLSAVDSGKADVKKVVEQARGNAKVQESIFEASNKKRSAMSDKRTILFLDEIHRFNKAQQDFLLPYVEDGTIILIGATTENPSFEVISALLSRCRVFVMNQHTPEDIKTIVKNALKNKVNGLGNMEVEMKEDALEFLSNAANGDPRTALNALEMAVKLARND